MRRISIIASIFIVSLPGLFSCKKLVTVAPPTTSIVSATAFSTDASASAAITGIYSRMMAGNNSTGFASGGQASVSFCGALAADELVNYPQGPTSPSVYLYTNSVPSSLPLTTSFWSEIYQYIYTANVGLEGLADSSSGVSPAVRKQLTGECKFIRAFCHFYLTTFFGNVPLITTSDYTKNQYASRAPQADVFNQIVTDLTDAENLLNADYSAVQGGERVRPIKWAAAALLARVYLYQGKWSNAVAQSSLVINSGQYALLSDLRTVFLKNSKETIWSLRPVFPNQNTMDAISFILKAAPNTALNNVTLSSQLLTAFEAGDNRRTTWVDSIIVTNANPALTQTYYFAEKYRVTTAVNVPLTEYSMVLRLAEQYLVRAEAETQLNDLSDAAADLNIVRSRAGLGGTTAATQAGMLTAVLHERQTELFTEWGHRWLDLKRMHAADSVMSVVCPQKGGTWSSNWQLWPIPLLEIQSDYYLTQNPGYN